MPLARLYSPFFPALLASVVILAVVYAIEHRLGLAPCPLGYGQRIFLGAFSLTSLCAVCHAPGPFGTRVYAALTLLWAAAGALVAGRHVWLQSAVSLSDSCSPALTPLLGMPWCQAIKAMLLGSPECTTIRWSFFDLTLPEWSLLAFLLLALLPMSRLLAYRFSTLMHQGEG